MHDRSVVVDQPFGEAEKTKELAEIGRRRRLFECTAQEADGDVARAPPQRAVGRAPQRPDDEGVARRLDLLEVDGDLLGLGAGRREHLGRPAVGLGTLRPGDVVVDDGAHHRMGELERQVRPQHVRARERCGGVRRGVHAESGEGGGVLELRAPTEDGHRPRERRRLGRDARQSQRHRAGHRLRPDREDPRRLRRGRLHALAAERVEQRLEEERIAAGRLLARVHELGRRLDAERLAREERRRVAAERVWPDGARGRVAEDLDDELLVPALTRRPRRDDDAQRQAVEPALQVGDPAE